MATDIPVATVDAARRSDFEVLPDHEYRYPADDFVRALVKERYDGTASTNKAIGNELYSDIASGTYPSWRIEQIARQLGLADEKRSEIIARSREADEGERRGKTWRQPISSLAEAQKAIAHGPATPTRTMLREDLAAIANEHQDGRPICEECGKPFEYYRKLNGKPVKARKCLECFRTTSRAASTRAVRQHGTPAPRAEAVAPTPPAPVQIIEQTGYVADATYPAANEAPRPLLQLLEMLPAGFTWTTKRRARWLAAFTATLDLLIEVEDDLEEARS